MELEKDKWYKFDPYNKDWSTTWWMKSVGEREKFPGGNFIASHYISKSHATSAEELHGSGQFGDYSGYQNYIEATPRETAWLEDIVAIKKYYPLPKEEINNNYEIF